MGPRNTISSWPLDPGTQRVSPVLKGLQSCQGLLQLWFSGTRYSADTAMVGQAAGVTQEGRVLGWPGFGMQELGAGLWAEVEWVMAVVHGDRVLGCSAVACWVGISVLIALAGHSHRS